MASSFIRKSPRSVTYSATHESASKHMQLSAGGRSGARELCLAVWPQVPRPITISRCQFNGAPMTNLNTALQQLRQERSRAQLEIEKLDQAISVVESLNGSGSSRKATGTTRVVSVASRRRMARAQRARWASLRRRQQPAASANSSASAPKKRLSLAARRKIAVAQRARWAKLKAQQKKAA